LKEVSQRLCKRSCSSARVISIKWFLLCYFVAIIQLTKCSLGQAIRNAFESHEVQDWIKKMTPWLEQLSLFQQSYFSNEQASDNPPEIDQLSDTELPIWLAAQRAVSRYEGFLSPVGPRGRLFRKLLTWIGFLPPLPEKPFELDSYSNASEPRLRYVEFEFALSSYSSHLLLCMSLRFFPFSFCCVEKIV